MPSDRSVLPADVLAAALRADATRPRLTFYDDAEGATRSERIELSAKVLTNWVSKAGNALQEELDVAPGSRVLLDLPRHWRAVYWALAVWSVGATLVLPQADSPRDRDLADIDLIVSDDLALVTAAAGGGRSGAVLVSLPMLSRRHPGTPPGVFDEARELATYGDVFDAWEVPSATAAGLVLMAPGGLGRAGTDRGSGQGGAVAGGAVLGGAVSGGVVTGGAGADAAAGGTTAYGELVLPRPTWGDRPRVEVAGQLAQVLLDTLSAWSADGSVVLVRDPDGDQAARRTSEGVTVRLH